MSSHQRRSFTTNEDHTQKISHSIFVTNFPDSINSRDLWRECSVYGTVVDVFIPLKKSQAGKRFAFVRFIKVFNLDRLVKNLCTIWIGRHHLFANKVRFKRQQKPVSPTLNGISKNIDKGPSVSGHRLFNGSNRSYTNAVNGAPSSANPRFSPSPAFVLDDNCIIEKDFTKHAMGTVKDANSIPNLQAILNDKGFVDVKLKYLGGMWVMFEFEKEETKANMLSHTGVNSWFHTIQDVIHDFVSAELIAWVDLEGIPLNAWSNETFSRIGKKWGETLCIEDKSAPSFGPKRVCILTKYLVSILESFKIIVKGKVFMVRAKELSTWNPYFLVNKEISSSSDDESVQGKMHNEKQSFLSEEEEGEFNASDVEGVAETVFGDNSASSKLHNGVSVDLDIEKDTVKNKGDVYDSLVNESSPLPDAKMNVLSINVQGLGNKTKKEWIKELSIKNKLNFIAIQETKMDKISHMDVKLMWGNSNYDFVYIKSLGNSGGLCLDRHLSFHRPILLREVQLDFGPIPFRFYHSWFSYEGFDDMVEQTWISFSHSDRNEMIRFKKKLQDLKIQQSIKDKRLRLHSSKQAIHDELTEIDKELDRGMVADTSLIRRQNLKHQLQDIKMKEAADSAFVYERQILDGPFIINEILHWCKRKWKKAMFFKVDFAKAYDSVRWDYLIDVLMAFGSGSKWCQWIQGMGVQRSDVELAASSIGCSIMNNQFRYLGVMVGENMARHKAWVDVILKLRSRLSKWKMKTLSIGGRLTLLKSVLGASPLYNMSIFKAPKGVLKQMESIHNNSLSGPILRIRKLRGLLGTRSKIGPHSVHVASNWCSILWEMHLIKAKGFDFMSLCSMRVGNGNNTRFWLDIWKGDSTLREDFPRMWWELDWQFCSSFSSWNVWFASIMLVFNIKSILEGVFYVAWWSIWAFRNRLLFDDKPPASSTIIDDIMSLSFHWCKNRCNWTFSWETWFKKSSLDFLLMFLVF
nr:RNA-directed DNA polymerase, eukaryota, nucleotide-binding alpha-beta plait domain protein [Tanacetum cinerariifolium]